MKISGHFNSPDFWSFSFVEPPTVLLDGRPIEHVCFADDVEGVVVTLAYSGGMPLFDRDLGEWVTLTSRGYVEFVGRRCDESVH